MENTRFKVGDRVKIKSLGWYNKNKDEEGNVSCGEQFFIDTMAKFCGKELTIIHCHKNGYCMKEDEHGFLWTDKMIERYADIRKERDRCLTDFQYWFDNHCVLPDSYNVINATKIVLEKKKKEYPKTYEECCEIMEDVADCSLSCFACGVLNNLQKLLLCRDAYWKIAGEEMGLGKPWEPIDNSEVCYGIFNWAGKIQHDTTAKWCILTFPTEEMRDAFYENFKELIESVKELL